MSPQSADAREHAPATARNRDAILDVLRRILPKRGLVLEIASGTGQHAAYFSVALPELTWQPSDPDAALRASIAAWSADCAATNIAAPLDIDATGDDWSVTAADAVVCINMIHIAPWEATEGLIAGAARLLAPAAPLYLYGPYRVDGRHTAPSNADFDAMLRRQNAEWGVRDVGDVAGLADRFGFHLDETVAMPANNLSVVLRRT